MPWPFPLPLTHRFASSGLALHSLQVPPRGASQSLNLAVCPAAACLPSSGAKVPHATALWLSVLRRPVNHCAARPPIGARHRSGSGNAITEFGHHIYPGQSACAQNTSQGFLGSQHRASAISLTGWSSGRQRLSAVGALRASRSGAAYLGR